jgi:pyrroloquinoline-quinone synthase
MMWVRLAEGTGLSRERVTACREVLPGVRFAVDAYINLVKTRSLLEAVASSLTELFSRDLISLRMDDCCTRKGLSGCKRLQQLSSNAA